MLLPQQVDVLREGKAVRLLADRLVPGDIVLLEQGNNIPADCRLVEAFGVRVNDATVTGESLSKPRTAGPSAKEEIIHAENILLAGTSMVSGEAQAVVFATGMHSEFGKIAHLTQTGREAVSPLREQITYLSRLIGILAVAIGLIFFAISRILDVPFWEDFIFAIGIIVAMVFSSSNMVEKQMNKYAGKPWIGAIAIFGVAGRISRAQSTADFGDGDGWRKGEVSAKSIGKVAFPVVVCPRDAKLPPGTAGKPVEQNRLGTSHREAVGSTGELKSETQNGNSS